MTTPSFDPYAPPRDLPPPEMARPPLPEGIRRYGLDVDGYHALVARTLRARIVRSVVIGALYLGAMGFWFRDAGLAFFVVLIPVYGGVTVVSVLFTRLRLQKLEAKALRGFEVLASPRVIRRTSWGVPPAEIAAPEVTSIVEVADGLSIVARTRRIFLSRAIADYAELRDHLRAWHPIETRVGLPAFLRKATHRVRGKVYDLAADAVITGDPSLCAELTGVRALAMPVDPSTASRAALRKSVARAVLLAAIALLILFLRRW